ncbi:MAG: ankyrin repeat domain-containing protein [Vulcanimicrobiota bacterium]
MENPAGNSEVLIFTTKLIRYLVRKPEELKKLLETGFNPDTRLAGGMTPLITALSIGEAESVGILLESGADPALQVEEEGRFFGPLHEAVSQDRADCLEMLLNAGAPIDMKGSHGMTALHSAVINGHLHVVQFLLDRGADINAEYEEDPTMKATPLLIALLSGKTECAALLQKHGACMGRSLNR